MSVWKGGKVTDEEIKNFTHVARFYGIPCYFHIETGQIVGTNNTYNLLLDVAFWIHNEITERGAQFLAAIFNQDYEPGFPIWIGKEI